VAKRFDSAGALGFFWAVFKARPLPFLVLVAWSVLLTIFLGYLQYDPMIELTMASQTVSEDDPSAMFAVLGEFYGAMGLVLLISLIAAIFLETAWLRLFLRGEGAVVMPFRVSGDEGAYAITLLAFVGIWVGLYIAWLILGFVGAFVVVLAFSAISEALAAVLAFFAFILAGVPFIWVIVRLSPSFALAVSRRKVAIGDAWTGTKGWFWSMFGAYVLAIIIAFILWALLAAASFAFGYDMLNFRSDGAFISRDVMMVIFAIQAVVYIVPQAIMRGIAVKAAMTIDEAQAPPANL
tara:strand:- start:105 stop:986 length:882 start_codon:yes stop_codon:yes gene_type:complete